jgi:hypothetical protein
LTDSSANLGHGTGGPDEVNRSNAVTGPLGSNSALQHLADFGIGRTAAKQAMQVELINGEQAVPELSVGGQSDTVT